MFVAQTGEPGPVWRDFSVSFLQPDVDDRAKLTRYPPAFYAQSTPRFEMDHMGCYVATTCIDMKGNSGGATIADLQMSAFEVGIDIDGSLDTVLITGPHWYPFALALSQQKLFYDQGHSQAMGVRLGRVDGFTLRGGLFLGGFAIEETQRTGLGASGSITGAGFDSGTGMMQISNSEFITSFDEAKGILQEDGTVTISSVFFAGNISSNRLVELLTGEMSTSSSEFNSSGEDMALLFHGGGDTRLNLTGSQFIRARDKNYSKPTIELMGGRTVASSNYSTTKIGGVGSFINVLNDNVGNRLIGNPRASDAYSHAYPAAAK